MRDGVVTETQGNEENQEVMSGLQSVTFASQLLHKLLPMPRTPVVDTCVCTHTHTYTHLSHKWLLCSNSMPRTVLGTRNAKTEIM